MSNETPAGQDTERQGSVRPDPVVTTAGQVPIPASTNAKPPFDRMTIAGSVTRFLLACVVTYVLEHGAHHAIAGHEANGPALRSLFGLRELYSLELSTWPVALVPRFTVIVHFNPETDPTARGLASNVCQQRHYLAKLLPAIAARNPASIVIDKHFTEEACTLDAPTEELRAAIAQISTGRTIVTGLQVDDRQPPSATPGSRPAIVKPLAFEPSPALRHGLVNLDEDPRRIPLGWTVREADVEGWRNSLAVEGALTREPKLFARSPRLEGLKAARDNPYMNMIAAPLFTTLQASDFLCTDKLTAEEFAESCTRVNRSDADPSYLNGRIAIVGETGRSIDRHDTSEIGNLPGTVLQANYIEALLADRYYWPAPEWLNYLAGFVFFVLLEAALALASPLRAAAGVIALLVASVTMLSLVARYAGYHVDPVTMGVLLLAYKIIGIVHERITHYGREGHAH